MLTFFKVVVFIVGLIVRQKACFEYRLQRAYKFWGGNNVDSGGKKIEKKFETKKGIFEKMEKI